MLLADIIVVIIVRGGQATLEDLVLGAWEDLAAEGRAVCPVCRDSMAPSADGGCRGCGSELS